MLERLTDTLNFQAQALNLRSERQRILASNIANADTPGYQARDMDFAQALKDATGMPDPHRLPMSTGGGPSPSMETTQSGHISTAAFAQATGAGQPALLYATPSQTSLDGNTVDMDRERASFADNTVHYEAALRFINSGVKTLMTAITGQS